MHERTAESGGLPAQQQRGEAGSIRTSSANNRHITKFLQASAPSAFDSNEEWAEVKDYLWLLGYPYFKIFAAEQPSWQGRSTACEATA